MGSMPVAKNPLTRRSTRRSALAYPSIPSTSGAMNNAQTLVIPTGVAAEWAGVTPAVIQAAVTPAAIRAATQVVTRVAGTPAEVEDPRAFLKPMEEESWRRLRRALVGSTSKLKK